MEITAVDAITLYYEYPPEGSLECAEGITGARTTSLVWVDLDEGLRGIGSAYSHPDVVKIIVKEHLAPFLIGLDPREIESIWERMYSLTRWYGRKGAAVSALGAVDIALWDLRGQIEGEPVYKLLGGERSQVDAYASALLWQEDISHLAAEAIRYVESGFKLMKMRLGHGDTYDRAAVTAVADAIRGRARLAVDGTHRYSPEAALALGRFLAEHDVSWFEEPFPPEDIDAYAKLRSEVDVPIAAGENEFGVQGFRELLRAEAIDIAQPDVSRAGGITECLRIARLAAESAIPIATHGWSDAVAVVANAHLAAAAPNGAWVEVDRTGTPLIEELLVEPLAIQQGCIQLSNRPGLGIQLDDEVVNRLALPPHVSIPPGNYADLVVGRRPYDTVPPYAANEYGP